MVLFWYCVLFLATFQLAAIDGHVYFKHKNTGVRFCMHVAYDNRIRTSNKCCSFQRMWFHNHKIYVNKCRCIGKQGGFADGDYLKVQYHASYGRNHGCSNFTLLNGTLAIGSLCVRKINSSWPVLRNCSGVGNFSFHTDGFCSSPKNDSRVVKIFTLARNSKYLSIPFRRLQMQSYSTKFNLYSNGEIWTLGSWGNRLSCVSPIEREDGSELKIYYKEGCRGASFRYLPDIGSYELLHTGLCIKSDGDMVKLAQCWNGPSPALSDTRWNRPWFTETVFTYYNYPTTKTSNTAITTMVSFSKALVTSTSFFSSYTVSNLVSSSAVHLTTSTTPNLTSYATSIATSSTVQKLTSSLAVQSTTSTTSKLTSTPKLTSSAVSKLTSYLAVQVTTSTTANLTPYGTPIVTSSTVLKLTSSLAAHLTTTATPNLTSSLKPKMIQRSSSRHSKSVDTNGTADAVTQHLTSPKLSFVKSVDARITSQLIESTSASTTLLDTRSVKQVEEKIFGPWFPWSSCTVPCGGGMRERSRTCEGDYCPDFLSETKSCNMLPCPVDGGFSDWSAWSDCNVQCGGGLRYKQRRCDNPRPQFNGLDCFGEKNISEICGSNFCPIHGDWTQWTRWSACDKPCNTGMFKRWRYCTNPAPLYDGNQCIGNATEAMPCNTRKCPAENIVFHDMRFDLKWNNSMITRNSEEFAMFFNTLKLNTRLLFEYSDMNSTYLFCFIEQLRQGSVVTNFVMFFSGLDSFQGLLLQDSIEDNYLGKLKILQSNMTYNTSKVPSSPPLNFTLTSSKTSIKAEWKEVPKNLQNGNVSGYILFYREKMLMSEPYKSLATVHLNATVLGLTVFTEYVFRVLSYNENGNGLATIAKSIITQESVPSQPPRFLAANSPSGFSIMTDWENIVQEEWNGIPVGVIVKYADLAGHFGNLTVPFPQSFAVIENLIPAMTYLIQVCHRTSVGEGPCQRIQCTTLPSAPSKAPRDVSVSSKIDHKAIEVKWTPLSSQYVHGDLKGYKVIYTLLKIASKSVIASSTTKIVHPSRSGVVLSNLVPNALYSVRVLATNAEGDGVTSSDYNGETCSCPLKIYTNYAASAPYIYRDSAGTMQGLFADMLNNLTSYSCGGCKQQTSVLDFVSNGKNGAAEKQSMTKMKKDIDDYVHLSFPIFGSSEQDEYNGHAFVPVFRHPGVVYFIIKDTLAAQVKGVGMSVLNTWPIFLINLLLLTVAGIFMWALESPSNSEFPRSFLPGVLNGMYWAYITMGTHGYGDKTPRSILARLLAVVWILIGMVNLAIFTGALTTALTSAQVYDSQMIYGVEVAAVNDTVEYRAGVYMNAKINTKAQYKSIEEVAAALKRRDVRGALVDIYSAATRSDLFKHPDIVAKKRLNYPSAFGFVLSGDMKNAASKFRDYVAINANKIDEIMKKEIAGLEVSKESSETVSLFEPDSLFFRNALISATVLLFFFGFLGILFHFYKIFKEKRTIKSDDFEVLANLEFACDQSLKQFKEAVERKLGKLMDSQIKKRIKFLQKEKDAARIKSIPSHKKLSIRQRNPSHIGTCETKFTEVEQLPSRKSFAPVNS